MATKDEVKKQVEKGLQGMVGDYRNTRSLVAGLVFQAYVAARPATFNARNAENKKAIREWVDFIMDEV